MLIILNAFVPSNTTSNYIKQTFTELQIKVDKSAFIVKDLNTLLSGTHRRRTQKSVKMGKIGTA